nr:MAG TPA: hypothetical protein [Caudoviricetes sp.]
MGSSDFLHYSHFFCSKNRNLFNFTNRQKLKTVVGCKCEWKLTRQKLDLTFPSSNLAACRGATYKYAACF